MAAIKNCITDSPAQVSGAIVGDGEPAAGMSAVGQNAEKEDDQDSTYTLHTKRETRKPEYLNYHVLGGVNKIGRIRDIPEDNAEDD